MIKIALAEDKDIIAQVLKSKIELSGEFRITGIARNATDLRSILERERVDLVLLDISILDANDLSLVQTMIEKWPQLHVLISTVFEDYDEVFEAVKLGAQGYVLKNESPERIYRTLYEVLEGGMPMSSGLARRMLRFANLNSQIDLSILERKILEFFSSGFSYSKIADQLLLSHSKVHQIMRVAFGKLRAE